MKSLLKDSEEFGDEERLAIIIIAVITGIFLIIGCCICYGVRSAVRTKGKEYRKLMFPPKGTHMLDDVPWKLRGQTQIFGNPEDGNRVNTETLRVELKEMLSQNVQKTNLGYH